MLLRNNMTPFHIKATFPLYELQVLHLGIFFGVMKLDPFFSLGVIYQPQPPADGGSLLKNHIWL